MSSGGKRSVSNSASRSEQKSSFKSPIITREKNRNPPSPIKMRKPLKEGIDLGIDLLANKKFSVPNSPTRNPRNGPNSGYSNGQSNGHSNGPSSGPNNVYDRTDPDLQRRVNRNRVSDFDERSSPRVAGNSGSGSEYSQRFTKLLSKGTSSRPLEPSSHRPLEPSSRGGVKPGFDAPHKIRIPPPQRGKEKSESIKSRFDAPRAVEESRNTRIDLRNSNRSEGGGASDRSNTKRSSHETPYGSPQRHSNGGAASGNASSPHRGEPSFHASDFENELSKNLNDIIDESAEEFQPMPKPKSAIEMKRYKKGEGG